MARPCLALLCNLKCSHIVADKSVRNFDTVSYNNRRNSNVSPVFVAGVGLERLIFTTGSVLIFGGTIKGNQHVKWVIWVVMGSMGNIGCLLCGSLRYCELCAAVQLNDACAYIYYPFYPLLPINTHPLRNKAVPIFGRVGRMGV